MGGGLHQGDGTERKARPSHRHRHCRRRRESRCKCFSSKSSSLPARKSPQALDHGLHHAAPLCCHKAGHFLQCLFPAPRAAADHTLVSPAKVPGFGAVAALDLAPKQPALPCRLEEVRGRPAARQSTALILLNMPSVPPPDSRRRPASQGGGIGDSFAKAVSPVLGAGELDEVLHAQSKHANPCFDLDLWSMDAPITSTEKGLLF